MVFACDLSRKRLSQIATRFGKAVMKTLFWKLRFKLQSLTIREDGQDLVEYALVISLVAIAAVASLTALSRHITAVFSTIDTSL